MEYKDYYRILQVGKTASPDEIKKAYRKLAVKCHPDKNSGDKGAEERFEEISDFYMEIPIDLFTALLGCKQEIITLSGKL